jgi:hypothetical protein
MAERGLNGQWVGVNGETLIIINADEMVDRYQGTVSFIEPNRNIPSSFAFFRTPHKNSPFSIAGQQINAVHPTLGTLHPWEEIKDLFPNADFSNLADLTGSWDDHHLKIEWSTRSAKGDLTTMRSQADTASKLKAEEMSWEEFKKEASTFKTPGTIFRGQDDIYRLRSSFHRRGRADLFKFLTEDLRHLHKHLTARTKHLFNLEIADQLGAFLNLIQHHGYPTPLLDWTYSPYVAAFFAYRGFTNDAADRSDPKQKVRIHVLDRQMWESHFPLDLRLLVPWFTLQFNEFIALDNPRSIPQQAISMIVNVDDIEEFVAHAEKKTGPGLLRAIDLPKRDRRQVIGELMKMGITAGSLFPGLDGACEEWKYRHFESL